MPSSLSPQLKQWVVETRRYFHRHPEVSLQEYGTSDQIQSILQEMGVATQRFPDMPGVVGLIQGRHPGPTLALRADIDALPLEEQNQVPYRSHNPGVMHACGHDANMAVMLGVAKKVMEWGLPQQMKGNLKFIFQPAEEIGAGARMMVEQGVLEDPRVDLILAGHLTGQLEVGHVGICHGVSHAAADFFELTITGRGAHGARPHQAADPVVAGSHLVTSLQSIVARNVDPAHSAVITVGKFHAGSAANVIPDSARLSGTVRTLDPSVHELVRARMEEICRGIEKSFRVECRLELSEVFPMCINHPEATRLVEEVARELLGEARVHYMPPTTTSEDFALYTQQRPGAIIGLGGSNRQKGIQTVLHSPRFDFDEEALLVGVEVFSEAVRRYLVA